MRRILDLSIHYESLIIWQRLSEDLYQGQNHFLMELIQNADDNSYDGFDSSSNPLIPTLKVAYKANSLRIDCNERGFSEKDMAAICSLGDSTKKQGKVNADSIQHIGEKGIGFKAVFKAADVVWIASRSYSIKFDKHKRLGMIAPIWAEFPEARIDKHTSFYLQLSKGFDQQKLVENLKSIEPAVLLFLRKLRKIQLAVAPGEYGEGWETTFSNNSRGEADDEQITLMQGDTPLRYIIRRHMVNTPPSEPKRQGYSRSEITLAFPIVSDDEQKIKIQKVYAFLPIREYGFTVRTKLSTNRSRRELQRG